MRHPKLIRFLSAKALALCLFTVAAGSSAHAAVVLDNLTVAPRNGPTNGTTIGQAFITGGTGMSLASVVFPQLGGASGAVDSFVPGEMCTVSIRNADGTVGPVLFANFTVSDGGTNGQTEADANTAFTLLPNTGYFFSVTAPSQTAWSYTASTSYSSNGSGYTLPATDDAYEVNGVTTTYFSLAQGPQLIYVVTNAVPEPSTDCLLVLAGAGAFLLVRRARAARAA